MNLNAILFCKTLIKLRWLATYRDNNISQNMLSAHDSQLWSLCTISSTSRVCQWEQILLGMYSIHEAPLPVSRQQSTVQKRKRNHRSCQDREGKMEGSVLASLKACFVYADSMDVLDVGKRIDWKYPPFSFLLVFHCCVYTRSILCPPTLSSAMVHYTVHPQQGGTIRAF